MKDLTASHTSLAMLMTFPPVSTSMIYHFSAHHSYGDSAIATMAPMPAQQWQIRQRNEGDDASTMTATMPAQQGQGCQHNDSNDVSTTRATTPAQGRQRHHHNNGNDASAT
jgi:hypothetical protein